MVTLDNDAQRKGDTRNVSVRIDIMDLPRQLSEDSDLLRSLRVQSDHQDVVLSVGLIGQYGPLLEPGPVLQILRYLRREADFASDCKT